MRVSIACEYSGVVRDAFTARGHDAMSCDILPTEAPGKHYQGDVRDILFDTKWDLVIAHPPCTDLSVSGARYFEMKRQSGQQQKAIDFFLLFTELSCRWAIENPIGIMSTTYRKPDQIVQPWHFGHPESKATCLWLNDLPLLEPTNVLEKPECGYWENQTPSGQNRLGPSADRAKIRARTYAGIAQAMSEQWS